jgi:glycosyltransferase involved in cell wall biosynthesis
MKQVLIIDYGLTGIYNLRTMKFVRYLPSYGWAPVILAARGPYGQTYDRTILEQIPPGTPIHQTATLEPVGLLRWWQNLNTVLRGDRHPGTKILMADAAAADTAAATNVAGGSLPVAAAAATDRAADQPAVADPDGLGGFRHGLLGQAVRWASRRLLIPDHAVGWLPFALVRALSLLRKDRCRIIYTVSHPNSTHLVGLLLKRLTGKPWVADFKDAWMTGQRGEPDMPRWRAGIERRMEAMVMTAADEVVSVSRPIIDSLIGIYGRNGRNSRFSVITNGFDPLDFADRKAEGKHSSRLTIAYLGTLWDDISCRNFVQALEELVAERTRLRGKIRVLFVGNIRGLREREWLRNHVLRADVSFRRRVPHRESLRLMRSADVLLLLINRSVRCQGTYTQKIFQYLGAGRPILALAPPGAAADLIREAGAGLVVDPDDLGAIRRAIADLYERYAAGRLSYAPSQTVLRRFERKRLTGDLAGLFDRLSADASVKNQEVRYDTRLQARS